MNAGFFYPIQFCTRFRDRQPKFTFDLMSPNKNKKYTNKQKYTNMCKQNWKIKQTNNNKKLRSEKSFGEDNYKPKHLGDEVNV